MKTSIYPEKTQEIEVSDSLFSCEFNEGLVHQVIVAYQAAARAGTKAQKTRSQVSGGGAKPWRQKGTGRARAGTSRSPLWRKGGKVFAATPRDYSQKVNRKVYRKAIACTLSRRLEDGTLNMIEPFELQEPRTKSLLSMLGERQISTNNSLLIVENLDFNLVLAARNLPTFEVIEVREINPYDLMKFKQIYLTTPCVSQLEEMFL